MDTATLNGSRNGHGKDLAGRVTAASEDSGAAGLVEQIAAESRYEVFGMIANRLKVNLGRPVPQKTMQRIAAEMGCTVGQAQGACQRYRANNNITIGRDHGKGGYRRRSPRTTTPEAPTVNAEEPLDHEADADHQGLTTRQQAKELALFLAAELAHGAKGNRRMLIEAARLVRRLL